MGIEDAMKQFNKGNKGWKGDDVFQTKERSVMKPPTRWPASYRGRPSVIAHSGLGLVVLRLGASRSTDGGVGEVHVRRHRARVRRASGLRVSKVVGRSRRRHAAVRRRSPSQAGHVWAATDTVGSVVAVRGGLKRLRRTIRVRSHRWSGMRCATEA